MRERLKELYLDWFNNYTSVSKFAAVHDLSYSQANTLLNMGRSMYLEDGIKNASLQG